MKSTKKIIPFRRTQLYIDLHEIAIEIYNKIVEMGLNEDIT